jgi:outer membrane lipoprotein SlyB
MAIMGMTLLSACAGQTGSSARGQEIRVRYAEVIEIERVKMPSAAPTGAVVGGFTGLVISRNQSTGRQLASGIGGAALGGLATAALEGNRLGYSYQLRFRDGSKSNFITEKGYLQRGDCVAVERGQYANIRRVADVLCADDSLASIEPMHVRDAQQCHAAKEQLLAATSDEEVELASRKVAIICEY